MRIIDGKRFYKKDMDAAVRIDGDGWDRDNGQNVQTYQLYYNPACGYVRLEANNSGDCYGDYSTKHYSSPKAFAKVYNGDDYRSWETLLGDVDESNEAAMKFVKEILG